MLGISQGIVLISMSLAHSEQTTTYHEHTIWATGRYLCYSHAYPEVWGNAMVRPNPYLPDLHKTTLTEFTTQDLTIRDATLEDLPDIVAIYNTAILGRSATAVLKPVTVEGQRGWFDAHSADRRPLWVAERDGKKLGWIGLADFLPRAAYHITAELSLYIDRDYQRHGIGRQLLQAMIEYTPSIGVENLISLVFAHNEGSIRLHEKLGFDHWGKMPQVTELDGVRRDVVVLGKRIVTDA